MAAYSVRELAAMVTAEVRGDDSLIITGVADLVTAQGGQISFLGNRRYLSRALTTKASAIIITAEETSAFPCTELRVKNPNDAFSLITGLFAPAPIVFTSGVHPTAVIGEGVLLGADVSIQPHAVIERGAQIGARTHIGAGVYIGQDTVVGEDSHLYPQVVIRERCIIGNRVILHSGVVVGSDGFGYETRAGKHVKIPQTGYVRIDDEVEVGANTTIDRGRFGQTWIQQGTKIDNLVQIAHNVVIGEHCILVAQCGIAGSSALGNFVTIAGQSALAGHIRVGDQSTVTAQSGVTKDIPAKAILYGRHAMPIREGLKVEAMIRRLPEILERIAELEAKIPPPKP
jgi:UDP-3-O-[3-hydroxymyristoyl] glucosamine N-acyltransferase